TASFSGDPNYSPSSASFAQVVRSGTSTSLTSSVNPISVGQPVTLTATVTALAAGADVPTGTVTFTIDGASQVVPLNGGQAVLNVGPFTVAPQSVTATYTGTAGFSGSSGSLPPGPFVLLTPGFRLTYGGAGTILRLTEVQPVNDPVTVSEPVAGTLHFDLG